jgi:hypothetical protein
MKGNSRNREERQPPTSFYDLSHLFIKEKLKHIFLEHNDPSIDV